jgi:AcrR family transcriptional regulator
MHCVAEVGYSRATTREIARLAGTTSGTLYHYYPNKAAMVTTAFTEMADIVVPRVRAAAADAEGVLAKLMAIFDEFERINNDYPHAAAFDRAMRAESAQHLLLGPTSESTFNELYNVIAGVIRKGKQDRALGPKVDAESASNAIYTLIRGLNEYTSTASEKEYHQTLAAVKALIAGTLFDYDRLR